MCSFSTALTNNKCITGHPHTNSKNLFLVSLKQKSLGLTELIPRWQTFHSAQHEHGGFCTATTIIKCIIPEKVMYFTYISGLLETRLETFSDTEK